MVYISLILWALVGFIFIGPRSDHSLPMSLTNWLTDSLTHDLVEDWMNWPKYADYADQAYYAKYAECAEYAEYTKPNLTNPTY